MDQSPSQQADSHSASHEIPRLLWNLKFYYRVRVQNSPPLDPITETNFVLQVLYTVWTIADKDSGDCFSLRFCTPNWSTPFHTCWHAAKFCNAGCIHKQFTRNSQIYLTQCSKTVIYYLMKWKHFIIGN
jgi:hypothetical protein